MARRQVRRRSAGYADTAVSDNLDALQSVVNLMPEPVEIAPGLLFAGDAPRSGNWLWHSTVNSCGEPGFENTVTLTAAEDGQSFTWGIIEYERIGPGIYQSVYDRTTPAGDEQVGTATFYESTPTQMTFANDFTLNGGSPCHIEAEVTLSNDGQQE